MRRTLLPGFRGGIEGRGSAVDAGASGERKDMDVAELADRNVLVMGLGRFGGGIGVSRWLCTQGARVTVTDLADAAKLEASVAQLSDCDITWHLGGHPEGDLAATDLVVVSPAVDRRKSEFFASATGRGIPWTTEINLFLERCPGRIIGVTGTAGKSTTCALLNEALQPLAGEGRRVWFGGNVGRSLLGDLPDMGSDDLVVLELSSFQLEATAQLAASPQVGLITNVWPNHLDRHGDADDYLSAKLNLFRYQRPGCWAVVGSADRTLRVTVEGITRETGARFVALPETTDRYDLRIPGPHNQRNAACAATIAGLIGVEEGDARTRMAAFGGLPHRLEHVVCAGGVDYYNDSKSTTPKGTATAVGSFDRPVVVIVGGQERGDDISPLVDAVRSGARAVVCVGASGPRIAETITAAAPESSEPRVELATVIFLLHLM